MFATSQRKRTIALFPDTVCPRHILYILLHRDQHDVQGTHTMYMYMYMYVYARKQQLRVHVHTIYNIYQSRYMYEEKGKTNVWIERRGTRQ